MPSLSYTTLPYGFRSISELLLYSIVQLGGNPQLLQLRGFYRMFQVWKGRFRAAFHLVSLAMLECLFSHRNFSKR